MTEWIYGRHAVEEALKADRRKVFRLLLADNSLPGDKETIPRKEERSRTGMLGRPSPPARSQRSAGDRPDRFEDLTRLARERGAQIERVPSVRLEALTRVGHHHQGVAAEVSPFPYISLAETIGLCERAGKGALVLILDSLQDPQNFGTLLRTAEAVGVTAIVMLDRRQVEVTPAVANASSGAVEHLNICLANNLPRAIDDLKEAGLWVYALQAEDNAILYTEADLRGPVGLVVGSEGRGVGQLVRRHCDAALSIPMRGKVESLNAAVAGSVVLYETLRQRTVGRETRSAKRET